MKEMMRYGFVLGLICLIATGLLTGMYSLTKARILAQEQNEEEVALKKLLLEASEFEPVKSSAGETIYYKGYNKDKKLIGVAFKASAKGYSSTIETLVGMLEDGTITAISILNQNETPGLGSRVTEPSFTGQFANRDVPSLDKVQAVTGATISSSAVIKSVKERASEIQRLLKE